MTPTRRALPIAPVAKPARRGLPLLADVDRGHRPTYAVWEVTLACDLACRHCGSRAGKARPDELTTAECLHLVEQLAELGVTEVTLIGGEAYLREDWLQIIRHIRDHGMLCSMTTGARGLDEARIRAAKDAGLQSISISVDGGPETHDRLRAARGSYDAAMRAFHTIRDVGGLRATANTQVNAWNLREIPATFDALCDAGISDWQVQITTAMGRAGDEPDMLLQPYQMLEVLPMLARVKVTANARRVQVWLGNNVGYFGPHEAALRGQFVEAHRGSCGAGRGTLGIEANGNIKGCPSLPTADYVGGNVRDHSLREIWERSHELRITRTAPATYLHGYCAGCYYRDECRGGCTWTSHVLLGKRGDNPYCHHRAIELLREGVRERVVKRVAAPNEPFDYGRFELAREAWPEPERIRAAALVASGEGWLA